MDKLKDKLHIRRKSQPDEVDESYVTQHSDRESIDSELAAMSPAEREAYIKEFEHAEKEDAPKKNSLIDKLIARGNKRTEEQLAQEQRERDAKLGKGQMSR
ncbi:hypothetical protein P280DRAFT_412467 [Massarina eburnea CBS 473.64]|uniref:Uncharacterized protein n=1 Tax=Massarina eburnea CBS 473.64 TaxID=1395130 RepID=A0A6A6RIE8_9PLEO|nr:hypothetical protein P280DRAFT_412467 [Massarina eburnea CBS 473.64]